MTTNSEFQSYSGSTGLVSVRSIIAGVIMAMVIMAALLGLGMIFGGSGLENGTTLGTATAMTSVWFLGTLFLSALTGAYFATRVSQFQNFKTASFQGLTVGALVVGLLLWQTFAAIGLVGRAAGNVVGGAATVAASGSKAIVDSPAVQNMAEDVIGDLNFKVDPMVVAKGVAARLAQGDTEAAKNYLARQAGINPAEADARIAAFKVKAEKTLSDAQEVGAKAIQATGWSLFLSVLVGLIGSLIGTLVSAKVNLKAPMVVENEVMARNRPVLA